jgi:transcriptional regulator with XRE-family HTH domain
MSELTGEQVRAARGLLGWSQEQLAEISKVSRPTIAEWERGARVPFAPNQAAICRAFEDAGLEILQEGSESIGKGVGVRFKKKERK